MDDLTDSRTIGRAPIWRPRLPKLSRDSASPARPASMGQARGSRLRALHAFGVVVTCALIGGCEKYELDRQMEELCKKDGGTKVIEKARLPKERFDESGRIKRPPPEVTRKDPTAWFGSDFRVVSTDRYLKDGDPLKGQGVLWRTEYKLFRNADNKLLATTVMYSRRGGDLFVLGHPSSNGCPRNDSGLETAFIREE